MGHKAWWFLLLAAVALLIAPTALPTTHREATSTTG
jgi:hypothetical protein